MNEPVSSPSLLTITAPPTKPPRAESEDFGKQLSSLASSDESRSPSPKKKDVKAEGPAPIQGPNKERIQNDTVSPEETEAVISPEEIDGVDTPEREETSDALVDGLVVTTPVVATPASESLRIPEAPLPVDQTDEIAVITGDTPDDASDPTKESLDLETDLETAENKTAGRLPEKSTAEGIRTETDVSETVAASTELAAKKSGEQEHVVPSAVESEENDRAAPVSSEASTNGESGNERKEEKARSEPSLLAKANQAAIQGDNKEQSETNSAIEKPLVSLPASVAAVSATVESASNDDTHHDTNDATGRNATSISAAEERTPQRTELTAAAKTRTNSAPTIDPSRFVSRVTKAFEAAQLQGGGPIRMRLSPPELGMLQVQIEVKEGVLTASLEAETHAARNLLLENLPALRDRLAEQQISIEKFDVDVRDESSDPDYEQANRQESDADAQEDRQNQRRTTGRTSTSTQQPTETSATTPSTISFDNDRVDLVA